MSGGWLGARVEVYRDGTLCGSYGFRYNSGNTSWYRVWVSCSDPAGTESYKTLHRHRWWADDLNEYAIDDAWTPIYQT